MADHYNSAYTGPEIDAAIAKAKNAITVNPQALDDAQKAQARENIGAQPSGDYTPRSELPEVIDAALAQAKASGEFKGDKGDEGSDGKSAYAYAQDAGYTGTEAEFAQKLAETDHAFYIDLHYEMDVEGIHMYSHGGVEVVAAMVEAYNAGRPVFARYAIPGNDQSLIIAPLTLVSDDQYMCVITESTYVYAAIIVPEYAMQVQVPLVTLDQIPTELPNPNALTFTGAVSGSYDGSAAKTINIPTIAGPKGETGAPGQRGPGLLAVTTAPSSYTTAVNGLTPAYRIKLSTVESQASTDVVYAGDTIRYSYYHYPVIYVDSSYVYCRTRVSIRGATGAAGATPVRGTDYWTDSDKAEIVASVLDALPTWTGGSY